MKNARPSAAIIWVLLSGLVLAAIAITFVYSGTSVTASDLIRASIVGASGCLGSSVMALLQRAQHMNTAKSLDEARHDALHDPLTGLVNRTGLYKELALTQDQARIDRTVYGVLFLDLNRFKAINDTLGHDAGDELLKIVAGRLKATTRNSDVVARLGGDEFVVIVRNLLDMGSVTSAARQILKRFAEPVSLDGTEKPISTSIGVAAADSDDKRTPEELVRDADTAMYHAKKTRSGFTVFDERQRSQLTDRLDLEQDLGRAFAEGELVVYYQPIHNVVTGRLYAHEALVRWEHPSRGLIPPDAFIPIASKAGLMSKLGEIVMREACAQAAVWNHLNPDAKSVRISVNVAEQQLMDAKFPLMVAEILVWSGLAPDQLIIEITEDVIVDHLDGLTVLHQLRDMGVNLAIDDFGTGQSSLGYVKQLDMVSVLKIDKKFVKTMTDSQADMAIIELVAAMAAALEMKVVAEGVEERSQIEALHKLGINLIQGYYFSAPVPASDIQQPATWSIEPRAASTSSSNDAPRR